MHPHPFPSSADAVEALPSDTSADSPVDAAAAGIESPPDGRTSATAAAPAPCVADGDPTAPPDDHRPRPGDDSPLPDAADASAPSEAAAVGPAAAASALPGETTQQVAAAVAGSDSESARPDADASAPAAAPGLSPAACAARLASLFPAVFAPGAFRPLKLRIQADIQERAPATFSRKLLSVFLHRHTTSTAYLKALVAQPQRVDLDGNPVGEIADEHRQAAAAELERRRGLHEARRVAERDAQRLANEEARRRRTADEEARRERAGLLRAFEASTLTPANFCALKGVAPEALEALLAQAREERRQPVGEPQADRAPAARRPEDRGRFPPRGGNREDASRRAPPGRKPGR